MLANDRFASASGRITVVMSDKGVCYIGLPNESLTSVRRWAARHFSQASLTVSEAPFEEIRRELEQYAEGRRRTFSFRLDHHNTPFSLRVLEAVSAVPFGRTTTYRMIARQVGKPGAARAVGRAVATNPLPLVIPCHRVVGSGGTLTGYGGGLPLKQALLRMESAAA